MASTVGWIAPQLAAAAREPFDDPGWLFERKLDGVRVIAVGDGERIRLWSRNHNSISASYPEIVSALEENLDGTPFVLDGEVVAVDSRGDYGDFGLLQSRIHLTERRRIERTKVAVAYVVFDLLHFDGHDARPLPLTNRTALLANLSDWKGPLTVLDQTVELGRSSYRQAVANGWEGVVAKRASAPYKSGRSRDWLKIKAVRGQEFVVGGFTPPAGSRSGFGALLVGYHDDSRRLRYAGRVGSGFSESDLGRLHPMLQATEFPETPFVDAPRLPGAHWVAPELVVQVRFSEWTSAGRLRAPVYQGVREDKDPAMVIREV